MKWVLLGSVTMLINAIGLSQEAMAQVVPDSTLGTQVTLNGTAFEINNGTRSGNNLFHSFSQFSIPTNGSAIFNNAADVQNIFSRVTGSQVSNIDGLLKTQGSANLFLMNPNGIVFGPNAQLQLGASFLGTTASGIKFGDGFEFNTVNATPPLLSVNLPIGLQMGSNPGSIQVNGTGHSLVSPMTTSTPYFPTGPTGGLSVQPGKTLALVGGPINLTGGGLTAEQGRIEIGSLGSMETIALEMSSPRWAFNYATTQRFSDITLSNRSIVDVSGAGAGSIQVQGQRVSLTDGSVLFVQNRGIAPAGNIQIRADSLDVVGGFAPTNIRSSIINETLAGNSGNIAVTARQINLINGGSVFSRSFGIGSSGNIDIKASESFRITGFLKENPELTSAIGTVSFSPLETGRSGNVTVSTSLLSLEKGGLITATTFGNAAAGNLNITADRIEITERNPNFFPSTISSSTFGQGSAGNIIINTRSLFLKDEGSINTASYSNGDAGSLVIKASESIEVGRQGNISSGVAPNSPAVIEALNLPLRPRGNAGSISIEAPIVKVRDQGLIIVSNTGLGNSGKVNITATQIRLDQQAQITAATLLGEGGNVILQSQSLILREGSGITATAGGTGNGGNITINSPIIVGLENSDIIANAVRGNGGEIKITTQNLFGLAYRPKLTSDNDITASSEFGISGNVRVNTIGINPTNALNALPSEVADSSRQIADRCDNAKGGRFIITGRGGMSQEPMRKRTSDRSWYDLRPLSTSPQRLKITAIPSTLQPLTESVPRTIVSESPMKQLVEASTIEVNATGAIALVASQSIRPNPSNCSGSMTTP